MDNKPIPIQKIKFPNRQDAKGLKDKAKSWLHMAIGFVLGVAACAGVNAWLNRRPAPKAPVVVQERPVLSGKNGWNPHEGTRVDYPGRSINYAAKFNVKNTCSVKESFYATYKPGTNCTLSAVME